MCFFISDLFKDEITADKDILCWKIVTSDFKLMFQHNQLYDKFTTYYVKDFDSGVITSLKKSYYGLIYEGIHSYSIISERDYYDLDYYVNTVRRNLIYCVIPKGEKYYYNSNAGEYVSLSIKRIPKIVFDNILENERGKTCAL